MGPMIRKDSYQSNADESGYSSASSSEESLPEVVLTKAHLNFLNRQLSQLSAEDILRWCLVSLPNLYQTTAFGLTGLVTIDMLSKIHASTPIAEKIDLIFFNTLYHFNETLELVDKVRAKYPHVTIHVFSPENASSAKEFEAQWGERLWETDDNMYDYLAKVEPAQRAYAELNVKAVLTGRRRSQGGKRGDIDVIEIDDAGLIKINPLASWTFQDVKKYIDENEVPYNALLDRGYKSVGDWHSTVPVGEGEDERSGRWKGQQKTECGIHNKRSKYAQYLAAQDLLAQRSQAQPQPTIDTSVADKPSEFGDSQDSAIDLVDVLRSKLAETSIDVNAAPQLVETSS